MTWKGLVIRELKLWTGRAWSALAVSRCNQGEEEDYLKFLVFLFIP